jgi:hypothetical protein
MLLTSYGKDRRSAWRVVWVEFNVKELGQVWMRLATAWLGVVYSQTRTHLDSLLGHLRRGICSRPINTVSGEVR